MPDIRPTQSDKTTPYTSHVTGWNAEYIDDGIAPRVFEVAYGKNQFGRLRPDGKPDASKFVGRLKLYAVGGNGSPGTTAHEELEYDLESVQWDGTHLSFVRRDCFAKGPWVEVVAGVVNGRTVTGSGTCRHTSSHGKVTTSTLQWSGTRAEVLIFGLFEKSAAQRQAWQDRTRLQLMHLIMADNPLAVGNFQLHRPQLPFTDHECQARDDNYPAWPRNYKRYELHITYNLPYRYALGQTLVRKSHAWLLLPDNPMHEPRRAVLTLNGHHGSAWKMTDPGSHHYWYAESFARRGYVALALDVGHRSDSPLYGDDYSDNGDDSDH